MTFKLSENAMNILESKIAILEKILPPLHQKELLLSTGCIQCGNSCSWDCVSSCHYTCESACERANSHDNTCSYLK